MSCKSFNFFFFRKIILPQINLVLKSFGDSTTDCVTEKILTKYLLKCKLSLVNSIHVCFFIKYSKHTPPYSKELLFYY